MSRLLSAATVTFVGLSSKALLNSAFCSVTVNGLHILRAALESSARNNNQGVITVANHISTLDDPVTWGVLPAHYYLRERTTRWALGASDIMFTNPLFSTFFRLGQTLETFRGKGIHQHAVDFAIEQLNGGGWVHLYGEGKVNQPDTYTQDANGFARLPRFKWGVGRMVMESKTPPVIIPMWLTGFEQLMPEGRAFPYKYFPRPGAELTVTFGNPISTKTIRQGLQGWDSGLVSGSVDKDEDPKGWLVDEVQRRSERRHREAPEGTARAAEELSKVRARVTAIIHDAVENLGRSVSGKSLYTPRQN
ncbi:acyltransferase-domain-containing protein [Macrolepiota fuliginosa MF-IS2]|uniref:Tafazzin family protein n=1 Tax=Macrolepiota fuliginosa MF-IS2 TaxID=1400762 RepID=A0A9P5XLZ4_9AGAR|nr:acyltransferase-domain-containing protein [Macrolepiota fuliginosa MF-IS2]